ncbi:hypothetical protein IFM89_006511 [Coptis chinensis]|uniref:Uncharacterized protein n=1 Tax=Coptis chinensis TaxID=261450 RepID=A0A835ILC9_9MAGN|nr:hypothetical protein IFM89_006511 [Coptis chinensis]
MMSVFFLVLALGGLALGLVFTMGWIFYFIGYSTGDPKNRMKAGEKVVMSNDGIRLLLDLARSSSREGLQFEAAKHVAYGENSRM